MKLEDQTASELSLPTLEQSVRTPIGRKLKATMMSSVALALAAGKSPSRVASDLGISLARVGEHTENWVCATRCQPPKWLLQRRRSRPPVQSRVKVQAVPDSELDGLMTAVECEGCKRAIAAGDPRAILTAFIADYRQEEDLGHVPSMRSPKFFHYCFACAGANDIRIPSPWVVRANPEQLEQMRAAQAEFVIEETERAQRLESTVTTGDMRGFNSAMPTTPQRDDAMARSVTLSRSVDEISTLDSDVPVAVAWSGEADQRMKVLAFLNAPASRGMRDVMRKAARLWVDGNSQNEIARKLHQDQSTISRMISGAKKLAFARS
jgi:hypothetical protein